MLINEFEKLSLKKFKIKSILPDATILCLGKRRCFKKGTKILMYNGLIKEIENIKIGDEVMGDDSTPRIVKDIHNGYDILYEITNRKGDKYTVNGDHILSLIYSGKKGVYDIISKNSFRAVWFDNKTIKLKSKLFSYKNKDKDIIFNEAQNFINSINENRYVDIPVKDFLKLSKKYQEMLLGYKTGVDFKEKDIPLDPYLLGYWLGDGTSREAIITSKDSAVLKYFAKTLPFYDCYLQYRQSQPYSYGINGLKVTGCKNNVNFFLNTLKQYDLLNNKHIPYIYKCNSREKRLQLLAGLLDSDGNLDKNEFEFTQSLKHEKLIDDVIYLARSLGFSVYKRKKKTSWTHKGEKKTDFAWRIFINGSGIEEIPTKIKRKQARPRKERVNTLVSQIKVTQLNSDIFYGFEVDKNHRFLLDNFTVVHNSGKSWLVRDIFFHHKDIPSGVVFSGTEEASPFFGDFIPDCFIHSEYDPELIDSIMIRQKRKIREGKSKGLSESGKHPSNNLFIVLDDMLHDAQSWKKDKTIKSIFFNGRHFNFLFILTMQYAQGIPPELRSNIDYVFIFNEPSVANRKKIYDSYAGMLPSFDHFCNILDACTQDHECMVIKTSGNSSDLRDQVFWYKAEHHTNFRVGHPKFWNFHLKNYNDHYEEDDDKDKEHLDKLKRKFAKTKKLKVIVSRQGDIVGYKENDE
jgi:hypothetical protein